MVMVLIDRCRSASSGQMMSPRSVNDQRSLDAARAMRYTRVCGVVALKE